MHAMVSLEDLVAPALAVTGAASVVLPVLMRATVERAWPAAQPQRPLGLLNYLSFAIFFVVMNVFAPVLKMLTVFLTNRLGGGLIELPSHGFGLVAGFILVFIVMDFGEYLFHRLEHAVPALWSMHSLHHSDKELDASTSYLHYWLVPVVHAVVISAPIGLLFRIPPIDLLLWGIASAHVFIMHANLPWDFGRLSWLITSPRYHRVHHSSEREYFDSNYASILPVWDVLFRTQHKHWRTYALPAVGVGDSEGPRSFSDLMFWPVRDPLRRITGKLAARIALD